MDVKKIRTMKYFIDAAIEVVEDVGIEKNSAWLLQHEPKNDEKQSDYALDYTKLIPILINSIQELSAKVEELESKINELVSSIVTFSSILENNFLLIFFIE